MVLQPGNCSLPVRELFGLLALIVCETNCEAASAISFVTESSKMSRASLGRKIAVTVAAAVSAVTAVSGVIGATASADPGAKPDHIFYIMMENEGDAQILGNTADAPYINQLAARYNVSTGFHGVTHPSLPNYL